MTSVLIAEQLDKEKVERGKKAASLGHVQAPSNDKGSFLATRFRPLYSHTTGRPAFTNHDLFFSAEYIVFADGCHSLPIPETMTGRQDEGGQQHLVTPSALEGPGIST